MTGTLKRRLGGTDRAVAFAETLARVEPLLERIGITRVADVTGLDRIGIPVWTACRPNSRSLSVSQGKGISPAAAKVSAIMECIELHHAERPDVPLKLASLIEMHERGLPTVDVSRLPSIQASRYAPARPMLWVEGEDIVTLQRMWLPYEVVHTSALVPPPTGSGAFSSTSNGLASGNTIAEATVHALCEVIERDAAAVWQCRPDEERDTVILDLDSVCDDACRHVLARFAAADMTVSARDITSDVGVPAFLCQIVDRAALRPTAHSGMGCHLDPSIALLRALTEAAQSRLTYITGSRDDILRDEYRAARFVPPDGVARARDTHGLPMRAQDREAAAAETFEQDIALIVARLSRAGMQTVLRCDLTMIDIGLPVVRVVVPGLEAPDDDPSYKPGRRADAPRRVREFGGMIDVFLGPSLAREHAEAVVGANAVRFLPPAAQGDIFRSTRSRPSAIVLIDGYFNEVPAPWHKEILWALHSGIPVIGASSMGALRAAELDRYGMIGIGAIYRNYAAGRLVADDEVVLLHGDAESGYMKFSEPLVDIRATLAAARDSDILAGDSHDEMLAIARALPYADRSFGRIMASVAPGPALTRFAAWLDAGTVSQKSADAIAALAFAVSPECPRAVDVDWHFERTAMWDDLVRKDVGSDRSAPDFADDDRLDALERDGERHRHLMVSALARLLASDHARRLGRQPGEDDLMGALARIRRDRSLETPERLSTWMESNELSTEGLFYLLESEVLLDDAIRAFASDIHPLVINQLRLEGLYNHYGPAVPRD